MVCTNFFLSQRSVYVLVLAGRDDKAQAEAEYWLQLIRAFATHGEATSPILVTLNKWESGEEKAKLDRRALEDKFPFIAGFIETDCKTGYGLPKLQEELQRVVAADKWVRQGFETAWWDAKEFFRTMKADTMRYEDYQKECTRLGVPDSLKQQDLARRLHDLGLALNFGEDPRLQLWTVLNPHWVTRNIYKLLRQGPQQGTGLMTEADLARVLPDEGCDQRSYLVQLMEEFDLAFAAGDEEDQWLVPQRLETNQPELPDDLKTEAAVRLRWTYKALPEGLLPEFITRTHMLSDDLSELRWANGVVLKMKEARVLVKADRQDKTITAVAAGLHPELMRHVEAELDALNEEIPGLEVAKEMEARPSGWVKVSLLRKMEPKGVEVPVTVTSARGEEDVEMVSPKEELNRIGPERARDLQAWKPLVFISYTDADRKDLNKLCDVLRCHEHSGVMEVWHDKRLTPGQEWNPEILTTLAKADVIVFLCSPRALGSDYIRKQEIPAALLRNKVQKTPVIPVQLEQTNISRTGLDALQGVKDTWRISVKDTSPQRHAWFQISEVLRQVCENLLETNPNRKSGRNS
jgi:internalin A